MEIAKILLSSVVSYAAIFISAKVIGRKQISQLDFLDYIAGITIGSIAAELATDLENMWKALLALGIYTLLTWIMSVIGIKSLRSRKFLNGTPTIIMDNGKLYGDNMKKAKLELSEFMVMCREQGYFNLSDIQTAVFEYTGKLTILPVSGRRPVTPDDMGLSPAQEQFFSEVIMDGRILDENLRRMGLSVSWLNRRLEEQGFRNAREVFLGLCDNAQNLTLYKMSE
jgi:uncharacterized membrane protein YcaP (DUF421 family)